MLKWGKKEEMQYKTMYVDKTYKKYELNCQCTEKNYQNPKYPPTQSLQLWLLDNIQIVT